LTQIWDMELSRGRPMPEWEDSLKSSVMPFT